MLPDLGIRYLMNHPSHNLTIKSCFLLKSGMSLHAYTLELNKKDLKTIHSLRGPSGIGPAYSLVYIARTNFDF
jgi:hypothetical protein